MKSAVIKKNRWFMVIISIAVATIVIFSSYVLSRSQINVERFQGLGYLGIFLATLLGSATLFFPVPNIATVIAGGVLFNPIGVAISAGVGATLGETVGYLVGLSSGTIAKDSKWYNVVAFWMSHYGGVIIFLLALVPNPIFDIVGLTAGVTRYPLGKFTFLTLIGKSFRSLFLAYLGSQLT